MEAVLQTRCGHAGTAGADRYRAGRCGVVADARLGMASRCHRFPVGMALYAAGHPADQQRIADDRPGLRRPAQPGVDRKVGLVARWPQRDRRPYNGSISVGLDPRLTVRRAAAATYIAKGRCAIYVTTNHPHWRHADAPQGAGL